MATYIILNKKGFLAFSDDAGINMQKYVIKPILIQKTMNKINYERSLLFYASAFSQVIYLRFIIINYVVQSMKMKRERNLVKMYDHKRKKLF